MSAMAAAYVRTFGEIDGYPEGWESPDGTREKVRLAGLHAHNIAGISGTAPDGADAIVLNGGYPDDADHGDIIVYTGHGGQDSNTKEQISDQSLDDPGNAGLVKSQLDCLPVRVIRGYKSGAYGPVRGYRYDGLYRVVRHWFKTRDDGFRVCQFLLVKLGSPVIIPDLGLLADVTFDLEEGQSESGELHDPVPRISVVSNRINRRASLVKKIKSLHGNRCQVCGEAIELPKGATSQAAHIKPIGFPHNGPDILENVLCLCPNDHVRFDNGALYFTDDLKVINALTGDVQGYLRTHPKHKIFAEFVRYHRNFWVGES